MTYNKPFKGSYATVAIVVRLLPPYFTSKVLQKASKGNKTGIVIILQRSNTISYK